MERLDKAFLASKLLLDELCAQERRLAINFVECDDRTVRRDKYRLDIDFEATISVCKIRENELTEGPRECTRSFHECLSGRVFLRTLPRRERICLYQDSCQTLVDYRQLM